MIQYTFTNDNMGVPIDDLLAIKSYTDEGYIVPMGELAMESSELQKIINTFKAEYKTKVYDFCTKDSIFVVLKNEKNVLTISGNNKEIYTSAYSKTLEDSEKLYKLLSKFNLPNDENEVRLQSFFMSSNGIDTKYKCYKAKDYKDINDSYYPYLDIKALFEQFFGNKENILICCGLPGTGKSKLAASAIKYCINNINKLSNIKKDVSGYNFVNVGYIKSTEILGNDSFWHKLNEDSYNLVILDDLDFFLTSRDTESISQEDNLKNLFLSQLLSFTDGIQNNKTKFIITTNQSFSDVDSALLRKGRLFDILELRKLTNKEALKIWIENGLDKKDFSDKFSSKVLPSDLGSEIHKQLNKKVKIRPYLLEKGISKVDIKSKKLGF